MELLAILITWYVTKLFYTRDIQINIPKKKTDLMGAICFKCARSEHIYKRNMRAPYYCMSCK